MRTCTLCRHPRRDEIDQFIALGAYPAEIASRFGVCPYEALIHRDHQAAPAAFKESVRSSRAWCPEPLAPKSFLDHPEMSPAHIAFGNALIKCLEPYPEAYDAVVELLRQEHEKSRG